MKTAADIHLTSASHNVGVGFSVVFTFNDGNFNAEWTPSMPRARALRRVLQKYRAARNNFLTEIAKQTTETVLCFEVKS
ncbi:hypothetical protein QN379_22005 [Glaciimonas sp. Gout2]|uniref:hypothetical protein n=1 Tax=unclassified Glaciimonas TaxID=2644401 RepID=UPI002B23D66B|nr:MULTISPECIES: hypothetical protein [unclassified Glaciimonas]MEB0010645.1 hypothetical protein [Glaciimonas sp. Cout2]MEB0084688.1 hypothetical protein [Glaciimonas sp. Gout2]